MSNVDPDVASYFTWRVKEWTSALGRGGNKKYLEKVIGEFVRARTTGKWTNTHHLEIPVHSKRAFISSLLARVHRGESVEVLQIDKGWFRLRAENGIEGWAHTANVLPKLPVELSSRPGGSGGMIDASHRKEIETGGRG
jgi:hypothetical protein